MSKILYTSQQQYLNSLRKKPDSLLAEIEEYAQSNKIPILNWNAAEFLEILITIQRPKRVLEIGTAVAYSSIIIARRLKKKGQIDTIEKSQDNIQLALENIQKAELDNKINLLEGDALKIMPGLERKYDFIFLDADKQDYEKLFYYSLMLLSKGGVLFVDNLLWQGYTAASKVPPEYRESAKHIREFNKLFTSQDALQTTILPIGDGVGIGIKL